MTEGTGRMGELPAADQVADTDELVAATELVDGRAIGEVDAQPVRARRRRRSPFASVRSLGSGITAVGVKELRGRMRGRRAFVILTVYLLFLAAFAWSWQLIAERTYGGNVLSGSSAAFGASSISTMRSGESGPRIMMSEIDVLRLVEVRLRPPLSRCHQLFGSVLSFMPGT